MMQGNCILCRIKIGKKILEFRKVQEKLEKKNIFKPWIFWGKIGSTFKFHVTQYLQDTVRILLWKFYPKISTLHPFWHTKKAHFQHDKAYNQHKTSCSQISWVGSKMLSWTAILWLGFIAYKTKLLDSLGVVSCTF